MLKVHPFLSGSTSLGCFVLSVFLFVNGTAQDLPFVALPEQLTDSRYAEWITMPGIEGSEYGVYYFRKTIDVATVPEKLIIHVSADNRYRLYINGKLVSWGPAAGDLYHWNYETIDVSKFLKEGTNLIAAQVWNMGKYAGARQISCRTAFILQGNSSAETGMNTNWSWKVFRDKGYFPVLLTDDQVGGGYIAGATDSVIAALHPWGWNTERFDDSGWKPAQELGKGNHSGLNTWLGTPWLLTPRTIPPMEETWETPPDILYVDGKAVLIDTAEHIRFTIPKKTKTEILLDNRRLTMGFPHLTLSGGKNSLIRIQYQEALFDNAHKKGNRNEWKGKHMKGYYDVFLADGGKERTFLPLWLRTFRYVKITIITKQEPLDILDFRNCFTAYPFVPAGDFLSNDSSISRIWDISWHTARLCALETYMDCPYYEQLQYIGDTRIQALISLYLTADDRLVRNALSQFYQSFQPMGLTKSSHPQKQVQIIPPFSLHYIGMLHDYFMLRNDTSFVKGFLPGIRFILDWFISKIDSTGMLGPSPFWNHIDGGTKEFYAGSPPGITEGHSALMSLLLALSINDATNMFEYYHLDCCNAYYRNIAARLISSTILHCLEPGRGLIAETPEKKLFSQHTNALAILAGAFSPEESKTIASKIVQDTSLAQASLYFNFYVFQALKMAGAGSEVLHQLKKWDLFLKMGFTTFPEHGIDSRSDCHAWSAHPLYDLLNIVCGIEPLSPGFRTVKIEPRHGYLKTMEGSVVHPEGMITVRYKENEDKTVGCSVELPKNVTGIFVWKGKTYSLPSGESCLMLE